MAAIARPILDLTAGETGTRGSPDLRAREAAEAARILGSGSGATRAAGRARAER